MWIEEKGVGSRIEDFFTKGDDFDSLLAEAIDAASTEQEENFTNRVLNLWEKFGMRAYITNGQVKWLRRIAGWDE